jgi:hypothetical protein
MAQDPLTWAMPPIEKIYEAFTALTDGRVCLDGQEAYVLSSDRKKTYKVKWTGNVYSSDDSASYWQGYLGYPVIAVLMLQGKIRYNPAIAGLFSGINWKAVNTKHHNDYAAAVSEIMDGLGKSGLDMSIMYNEINNEVQCIYEQIKSLLIKRRR